MGVGFELAKTSLTTATVTAATYWTRSSASVHVKNSIYRTWKDIKGTASAVICAELARKLAYVAILTLGTQDGIAFSLSLLFCAGAKIAMYSNGPYHHKFELEKTAFLHVVSAFVFMCLGMVYQSIPATDTLD